MRVAIVTPEHPHSKQPGGIGRYLRDYLPELASRVELHLITTDQGPIHEQYRQHLLPQKRIPSPLRPPLHAVPLGRILDKLQPDLVEYSNFGGLGNNDYGPWAKIVRLSTPASLTSKRAGILPSIARPLHLFWEKRTAARCDLWISNSNANNEKSKNIYQLDRPSMTIPHGIKPEKHHPEANTNDIIFIGRFEERKGLDILLKAWHTLLEKQNIKSCLHLVGTDTPGQKGSYLQECTKGFNFPPGKLKLHGKLTENELHTLRLQCSITVIPSRYESFGMVCLEGFAYNHVVIASNTGGLSEIITNNKDGILVPQDKVENWVNILHRVLSNGPLRQSLSQNGNRTLFREYSVNQMVDRSLKAYKQAVSLSKSQL